MNLLENLNEQQKEAVLYFSSPLLVIAGAGSGKTRVIAHKVAYMIKELKYEPERILAVTFTNKASREMKSRIESLVGKKVPVWVSTFHSFCARLLRSHSQRFGYSPNFIILDEEDRRRLLKEIISDLNLDEELYSPAKLSYLISAYKNLTVSEEFLEIGRFEEILNAYNEKLKKNNAFDFDDLLIYGKKIFEFEDLKEYYSDFFRYVLVDEYQDTNKLQHEIVVKITKEKGNVCVVGDEDQCIYSWRGADLNIILTFEKDFPDVKIVKLEQNYRSTKTIITAANSVISNNRIRRGKKLYTLNHEGEPIRIFFAQTDTEEGKFIAEAIKKLRNKNFKFSDIAVFYRTNAQSRAIEDALRKAKIPYQIVGGLKFYERKEIKDILAFLRAGIFEEDLISVQRILNVPPRGLGPSAQKVFKEIAEKNEGISNRNALSLLRNRVSGKGKKGIDELIEILDSIKRNVNNLKPFELVKFVVGISKYEDYLKREFPDSWEAKMENIEELGNSISQFSEENNLEGEELFEEFLANVSLSSPQDEISESEDKVVLMTVHASKGLEFPVVFVSGMEEGIFPHVKSMDSDEEIEEERRLFYVAMTRAKELLFLTSCKRRRIRGNLKDMEKSRFLEEIPKNLTKLVSKQERSFKEKPKVVLHKKFGRGIVLRVEGEGENAKITAFFPDYGQKTIVKKFLQIIA